MPPPEARLAEFLNRLAPWMAWIGVVFFSVTLIKGLSSGRLNLRGIGVVDRASTPGRYWRFVVLQAFVGLVCLGLALGWIGPS